MAAFETFRSFTKPMTKEYREALKDYIKAQTDELLAARSEDARNRLVQQHIKHVHDLLRQKRWE